MKKVILLLICVAYMVLTTSCHTYLKHRDKPAWSGLMPSAFIMEVNEEKTHFYRLTNRSGAEICISDLGARILSLMVPDRDGVMRDVVLGYDSLSSFFPNSSEFGATIGRYANRICNAKFALDGDTVRLPQNNGSNCLHGGTEGWQRKLFSCTLLNDSTLKLAYSSPDGDMGFPGQVNVEVTFRLTADNSLILEYDAIADKRTVINMTNHAYFNLSGDASQNGLEQVLYVNADNYTPTARGGRPTGEIKSLEGTPLDFRQSKAVMRVVNDSVLRGIDTNYVLNTRGDKGMTAASLFSPLSGILMEVFTTEPGMQIYTANMPQPPIGKNKIRFNKRPSVCLETQHFPDSPNHPEWPTTFIDAGQPWHSETIYRFSVIP